MGWIELVQNAAHWWALVVTMMDQIAEQGVSRSADLRKTQNHVVILLVGWLVRWWVGGWVGG